MTDITSPQIREGEHATMIIYSFCFGTLIKSVRKFKVSEVGPYAQHKLSISIDFVEPRKRRWRRKTVVPNDIEYVT